MAESTIQENAPYVTFINVFTVPPDRQNELLSLLVTASDQVMRHQPGFISGNFHVSADGTKVINYVQWEDEDTLKAAQTNPDVQQHMAEAVEIADRIEPLVYRVAAIHHR